jgi:hypothetical protein
MRGDVTDALAAAAATGRDLVAATRAAVDRSGLAVVRGAGSRRWLHELADGLGHAW